MSEFEFQTSIDESIGMVRDGQRLPRKECHFIPEGEYRKLMELKRAPVAVIKEEPTKWSVALHIAHALAPLFIGATWILDPGCAGRSGGPGIHRHRYFHLRPVGRG